MYCQKGAVRKTIQDNLEKNEAETTAQATKKRNKPKKTPDKSMDIKFMLGTVPIPSKISQVSELIEID